jgi:hypothetical protein
MGVRVCSADTATVLLLKLYIPGVSVSAEQNLKHLSFIARCNSSLGDSTLAAITRTALVPVQRINGKVQLLSPSTTAPVYLPLKEDEAVQADIVTYVRGFNFLSSTAAASASQDRLLLDLLTHVLHVRPLQSREVLQAILQVHDLASRAVQPKDGQPAELGDEAWQAMMLRHLLPVASALADLAGGPGDNTKLLSDLRQCFYLPSDDGYFG